jgi:histidinol-phosphate aminotransferase
VPLLDAARSTAIPLGVTAASTAAALASLEPAAEAELLARVETIAQRREALRDALVAQGWPVPRAHGNFIWLPTGERTTAVADRLFDAGLVTRAFPPDGIRISVGEPESVDTLLRILGELVPASQEGHPA